MAKKGWRSKSLTAKARHDMPRADFALAGHGSGAEGKGAGAYPIENASHARSALSLVSRYGKPDEKAKVRAAIHAKYPNMGKNTRAETRYRDRNS